MFSQPLEETGAFFVARFFSLKSRPLERLFLIITTHLQGASSLQQTEDLVND